MSRLVPCRRVPGKRLVTARKGCRGPSSPQASQPSPRLLCSRSEGAGVGGESAGVGAGWPRGDSRCTPPPSGPGHACCGLRGDPRSRSSPRQLGLRAHSPWARRPGLAPLGRARGPRSRNNRNSLITRYSPYHFALIRCLFQCCDRQIITRAAISG